MQIKVNNKQQTVSAKTVEELIMEINLKDSFLAVAINGSIVRKNDWNTAEISENDSIDIMSIVGGG